MYYDQALVLKYLNKMPRLKVVLLPAIFYTMGTELSRTSESWRMYFYRQYFNIPLESKADRVIDWSYFFEPENFSKIALFGERSYDYTLNDFRDQLSKECTANGWFDSGYDYESDLSKNVGPKAAKAHNLVTSPELYSKNLGYWAELVIRLKERNIIPIILLLPSDPSYHDNIDPALWARMKKSLQDFADRYRIQIFDYTRDPRFTWQDYAVSLPDHLNARGAEKFSRIINKEIIVPAIERARIITVKYDGKERAY